MKSRRASRILVIAVCAVMILSSVLLFSAQEASAQGICTWTTYDDFIVSEELNNVVVNNTGIGDDAYLELA